MFTGLIQELGTIDAMELRAGGAEMRVRCGLTELVLGESIAVDGVCLTVARVLSVPDGSAFELHTSSETLSLTTLGDRKPGDGVHLERALSLADRLGGHIVTGHVDGVGRFVSSRPAGDCVAVTFEAPGALAPFVAPKGCVAVDGVSLTVNSVAGARFEVMLIPHTLKETTFGQRTAGARVNLEVDVLAKYVARLSGRPGVDGSGGGGVDLSLLQRYGFA